MAFLLFFFIFFLNLVYSIDPFKTNNNKKKGGTRVFEQFQWRVFEFQQQLEHALHALPARHGFYLA